MRTRNWNGALDTEFGLSETLVEQGETSRHESRRSRSPRTAKRRSSRRAGSPPAIGISGRRNRRFSW
jgi:hypothetical protein